MANKRVPLSPPAQLSENLIESTGKGLNALFGDSPTVKSQPDAQRETIQSSPSSSSKSEKKAVEENKSTEAERLQERKKERKIERMQDFFHLDEEALDILRTPALKNINFRLSETETEWLKDTAHELSKEFRNSKVSQMDILRISLRFFESAIATNKNQVMRIIEESKKARMKD